MEKVNEVKKSFVEIYDEAKERIETLIEDDMYDVDGVYTRDFGDGDFKVTISPSQKYFEIEGFDWDGITIWLSDGMEEGFKKNFKRLIEIYYDIDELDSVIVDGEEYAVLEKRKLRRWKGIYCCEPPVFVRSDGEVIEPKYDKEEDVLYWTLLIETEDDEWMDYYQSAIEEEVEA